MSRTEDIEDFGNYNTGSNNLPDAWVAEYKNRCTSSGQVFAGGGSQISSIKQDSEGEVYVVGRVRKKKEGVLTCSLMVRGAHCVLAGVPYLTDNSTYGTKSSCQSAGGSWVEDDGWCSGSGQTRSTCIANSGTWNYRDVNYNNVATTYCGATATSHSGYRSNTAFWDGSSSVSDTAAGTYSASLFSRGWLGCQPKVTSSNGGDQWTDEYKGLAKVNPDTKSLTLLSGTDEQAINLWLVNDVPYYSTFNTTQGKYFLKRYDSTNGVVAVAENFEAYNLSTSNEDGKLFYDGLDFSTNSYSFGTLLETAPYTRTIKTGLTGTVKTIVILPE
jgi:prepilin-type processing-associated H-X9-DG protein